MPQGGGRDTAAQPDDLVGRPANCSQGNPPRINSKQGHVRYRRAGGEADRASQGAVRRGSHRSARGDGGVTRSLVECAAEDASACANGHVAAVVQMGNRRAENAAVLRDETAADPAGRRQRDRDVHDIAARSHLDVAAGTQDAPRGGARGGGSRRKKNTEQSKEPAAVSDQDVPLAQAKVARSSTRLKNKAKP